MIEVLCKGIQLAFHTAEGVFSPKEIDRGTLAMLSMAERSTGFLLEIHVEIVPDI